MDEVIVINGGTLQVYYMDVKAQDRREDEKPKVKHEL